MIKVGVSGILLSRRCVLLGRRVKDDPALPGLWCTPGGGVEDGETLQQALEREFIEEVGLRIQITHPLPYVGDRFSDHGQTVLIFYRVQLKHPDTAIVGDGFDKVELFDKASVLSSKRLITPLTFAALEHLFL